MIFGWIPSAETLSSRLLHALGRSDLAIVINGNDSLIDEALDDLPVLVAISCLGLGRLELGLHFAGGSELFLHLGHLFGVPLLILLPACDHLLHRLDFLSPLVHAGLLGSSVSDNLCFAASLLR